MKRILLLLITFLSLSLTIKSEEISHDTLCIYLKNGNVNIIPGNIIKQKNSDAQSLRITLKNDTLLTYAMSDVDSLGDLPTQHPKFTMFKFNNKYNHNVYTDVFATIGENEITATVGAIGKSLTPSFQLDSPNGVVSVNGEIQTSKVSRHRFADPVVYTLSYDNCHQLRYTKVKDEIWSEAVPGEIQTEEIPLKAEMLSTNAPSNYGDDVQNLIDKNDYTYFHSTWGYGQYEKLPLNVAPYIEVALDEAIDKMVFKYTTSHAHDNRYPYEITVQASNDRQQWKDVATLNEKDGMPTSGLNAHFTSPAIHLGDKFRFFRFKLDKASYKNYFVLAEFSMHKVTAETGGQPPQLISPAEYAYSWVPFGKNIPVKVDWKTDHATNVPRVDINVKGGHMIEDKVNYLEAEFIIDGAGVFPSMKDSMRIRGRGNSSWAGTGKSPYRLKFDHSVKPFGLTKGKNWVLLANRQHGSMLTNAVGMKVANMVKTSAANQIVPVELYINGEYRGNYNLTQQVGLHNNSVDIVETYATMLELDTYYDEDFKFLNAYFDVCTNIKAPDLSSSGSTPNGPTFEMIKKDFDHFSRTLSQGTEEYTKLMNIPLFARYILVNELVANAELKHPKSCFLYKEDLLALHSQYIFGPVWDFDWAYGYEFNHQYCVSSPYLNYYEQLRGRGGEFFKALCFNSVTVQRAYYKEWKEFIENDLQEVLDYIDDFYAYARPSLEHNASRWGDGYDYEQDAARCKDWIKKRAEYIYGNLLKYDLDEQIPIEVGDVNRDGAITLADAICVQNYVLNLPNESFDAQQADANKNGIINMTDAVWIIALAMKAEANEMHHMQLPVAEANWQPQNFVAALGDEAQMPLTLNINRTGYAATQFDITLPEGLSMTDVNVPGAWAGYSAEFEATGHQQYRVAIYGNNGATLPLGTATLQIRVASEQMIPNEERVVSVSAGRLVTETGEDERLGKVSARFDMEATGIGNNLVQQTVEGGSRLAIESLGDGVVKVYTVDGRLVKHCKVKAGKNLITLPSGVYIVNQKKVVINN